jgi:DNA-binding protein HU-beta
VNKSELIQAVGDRLGEGRGAASKLVDTVFDEIQRAVARGEKVALTGFGVFEKRNRAARTARNPATGATVKVKKTSVPAFRAGQGFKDVVSGAKKPAKATAGAASTASGRASGRAAAKPAAAKSTAAKKTTASRSAAAKTTTPSKSTTSRSTGSRSTAAKTLASKSTSGGAKKTAGKALASKSSAAKKAPARKAAKKG